MIPQRQKGRNCYEACLAAILEIDQKEVPSYRVDNWFELYDRWVSENFGFNLIICKMAEPFINYVPDVFHIISGELKTGGWHSRVGKGGLVVFDPSNIEYKTEDFKYGYWEWEATLLIKHFDKKK